MAAIPQEYALTHRDPSTKEIASAQTGVRSLHVEHGRTEVAERQAKHFVGWNVLSRIEDTDDPNIVLPPQDVRTSNKIIVVARNERLVEVFRKRCWTRLNVVGQNILD
jgi:hypothetical protein